MCNTSYAFSFPFHAFPLFSSFSLSLLNPPFFICRLSCPPVSPLPHPSYFLLPHSSPSLFRSHSINFIFLSPFRGGYSTATLGSCGGQTSDWPILRTALEIPSLCSLMGMFFCIGMTVTEVVLFDHSSLIFPPLRLLSFHLLPFPVLISSLPFSSLPSHFPAHYLSCRLLCLYDRVFLCGYCPRQF